MGPCWLAPPPALKVPLTSGGFAREAREVQLKW